MTLELLGLLAGTALFYFIARHLSPPIDPTALPPPPVEPALPVVSAPAEHPEPVILPPSMRQVAASPLQVRGYWFSHSDANLGPSDAAVFYDQVHLDLYDPRSGQAWEAAFVVATPQGLARALREGDGEALFEDNIVIVPRYNVAAILKAIVERLEANWEAAHPPEPPEPPLL